MEQLVAEYMSLSPGEKVVFSFIGVYLIVTTIWAWWIIYRENWKNWLAEEKENRSLIKLLKFW